MENFKMELINKIQTALGDKGNVFFENRTIKDVPMEFLSVQLTQMLCHSPRTTLPVKASRTEHFRNSKCRNHISGDGKKYRQKSNHLPSGQCLGK